MQVLRLSPSLEGFSPEAILFNRKGRKGTTQRKYKGKLFYF
jgi:hypothetical protein